MRQWTGPCELPVRRWRASQYTKDEARSAMPFDTLRRAVDLDDEHEHDLAEVLAGCSPEELDELAALAEMDGDE